MSSYRLFNFTNGATNLNTEPSQALRPLGHCSLREYKDIVVEIAIDSWNLVPRAYVTLVQRNESGRLWNNPKPEPQTSGSG